MKTKFTLYILLCAFLFSTNSNAQIFSKISKSIDKVVDDAIDSAVENTVGEATERIAERMLEKIMEKIFSGESVSQDSFPGSGSSTSDSTSSTSPGFDFASILGGGDVDKSKVYDFTHKMKMEMSSENEEPQYFDYYFHDSKTYIGMEVQSMFIILDLETEDTYTIMNGNLIKMNMNKIVEKMSPQGTPGEVGYTKVTKTGKKEMIVGHMCEEYIAETEEGVANIWITEDFVNQNLEKTSFIQNIKDSDNSYNVNGMFFRYRYVEKGKEDDAMIMNVIEFNPSSKTINFKDY